MNVAPVDVRRALFAGCTGFTELRYWGPGAIDGPPQTRVFHDVRDEDSWRADCRRLADAGQLFWGAATRRTNGSGKKGNLLQVPALWADQDFLREDGTGYPEADLRKHLATFPLPPSITLHSGNGLQSLWLLDVPADAQAQQQEIERLNGGLARVLSGDDVGNVDRILRVPGSWHRKQPSQPRRVTVETFEPTRRYALTQLQAVLEELRAFEQTASQTPPPPRHHGGDGPGRAYNVAPDIQTRTQHLLQQHGWTVESESRGIVYLVRPGKHRGKSASLGHGAPGLFYSWSNNAAPFQPLTSYSPFGVYAELEHVGDYRAAAKALAAEGFGHTEELRRHGSAGARDASGAGDASQPPAAARVLRVRCAADVQPVPLRELWPGYLYRGKLSLLAGMGEVGKTYVGVCDVAARGSRGRCMPDGSHVGTFRTLIVSAEDSAEDTLVPRLRRLGADMSQVFVVDGGDAAGFLLGRDLGALEDAIVAHRIDVVYLDALNSFIGGRLDTNQDAAIRSVLGPVVAMAAVRDVAVVGVAHFGKGEQGHVVNKILGSVGFANLARVVMGFAPDVEQPGRAFMAVVKNNLAPKPAPLAYRIDPATGLVAWETAAGLDVVGAFNAKPTRQTGGTQAAADWLRQVIAPLGTTGMPSSDVLARGAEAGYRRDMLFEAKKALGVRARKLGFAGGWTWYLDAEASDEPRHTSDPSTLRESIEDFTKSREEATSDSSDEWQESSFEASEESALRESDSSHEGEVAADVA